MYQKFHYSGYVKVITAIILGIALLLAYMQFTTDEDGMGILYALLVLIVGIVWPFLRSPKGVYRDEAGIILYRQYGKKEFSAADYEIEEYTDKHIISGIRIWASGGYFGFWGLFWLKKYGFYRLYQTNIRTQGYLKLKHRDTGRLYFISLQDIKA